MEKAAIIASELTDKKITTEDMFKCLMALKLSRLSNSAKFDSFVDLIGYTEGWWNYLQQESPLIGVDKPIGACQEAICTCKTFNEASKCPSVCSPNP